MVATERSSLMNVSHGSIRTFPTCLSPTTFAQIQICEAGRKVNLYITRKIQRILLDYYWCYTKALQRHMKLSRKNEVVHFHRDLPIRWKKCNNPCNSECEGVCCGCKDGQCWSRCDWMDQIPKCYTDNFFYNIRKSWCHTANSCSVDSDCNLNNAGMFRNLGTDFSSIMRFVENRFRQKSN